MGWNATEDCERVREGCLLPMWWWLLDGANESTAWPRILANGMMNKTRILLLLQLLKMPISLFGTLLNNYNGRCLYNTAFSLSISGENEIMKIDGSGRR